jgi:putative Mg2+ transporter-C (MgtC) family protein
MAHEWLDTLLRLGAAVVAGGVIGYDRELSGRPAGLRTHMLVSLGSAMVVLMALRLDGPTNVSRVIQGVVTGIGFLCAGDILHLMRNGHERVKGLTSAAALWVTSAIGMVAACAQYSIIVIGTVLTMVILAVLRRFEPTRNQPEPAPPAKADP